MTTNINSYILGASTVQNTNLHNNVFGNISGTAVEGDTQLTLNVSGDLSGGGTITLGSGGTLNISYTGPSNVSEFTNDSGYLTSFTETDPTVPAHVKSISGANITNWNTAYGWGDHSLVGYLTSFTETDPVFQAHPTYNITNTQITEWDTAYGWGDHSIVGYLTSFTETDPTVPAHVKSITSTEKSHWNTAYGWGNHATFGYITSFTDTNDYVDSIAFNTSDGVLTVGRTGTLNDLTVDLDGRYQLTGTFAETDTLDSVTTRGNTTTNDITVHDLTVNGNLTVEGTTTTINATELSIDDNMIYLNDGSTVTNPDLGWAGNYNDGTYAHAGMFRDATDGRFKAFDSYTPEPGQSIDTAHASFNLAPLQAEIFYGPLSGNATTASKLETARTITLSGDVTGSASFDGSSNINISTTGTYLNSASFNTTNGVLTLTKNDSNTVTVDLDGRFTDNSFADAMNQGVATTDSPDFVDVTATNFHGTATTAKYADLAEKYTTEIEHPIGTVMMVSSSDDYETCPVKIMGYPIGVISEKPAFLMNEGSDGQALALKGRVPVRVLGPIKKGEAVHVHSDGLASKQYNGAPIVGVALETNTDAGEKLVECVLKT